MNGVPKTEQRDYMRIRPIDEGIVIDHLLAHTGLFLLNLMDYTGLTVTPGLNYRSDKLSEMASGIAGKPVVVKKDIIFIEGGEMTDDLISADLMGAIQIVSPTATVNYVKGGAIVNKIQDIPNPEYLGGILLCANDNCTTNTEGGTRRFRVIESPTIEDVLKYTTSFQTRTPFKVQCCYCEKQFFGPLVRFYTGQTLRDVLEGEGRFFRK
ncbi:aspartate carbamoyltransferase regulatory subunit [Candidatus Woesearchaeota archaeon]|nr:aspartate carbamoyltransferase regulatory subunit [Candidatus Woesearchaeota archaeon]